MPSSEPALGAPPPLAWWTLAPGLLHFNSPDGQSYLAYRVVQRVAVTLGEPIGPAAGIPALIEAFKAMCRAQGLLPCWWHVTASWLPCLADNGERVALIGGYATLHLPGLRIEGQRWREVRGGLRRLPALGFSTQWYDLAADPQGWRESLAQISRQWLARRRLPEIGHSIGTWDASLQRASSLRCLALLNPEGQPCAFMTFAPLYGAGGGWGLDLLRHETGLPRESMLYLLGTALLEFQSEGALTLSLGLAPFSHTVGSQLKPPVRTAAPGEDTPLLLRMLRRLAWQHSRGLYNFQGLAHFKQRLHPQWEARYVVYPGLARLPRILRALCHAHGFKARLLLGLLLG